MKSVQHAHFETDDPDGFSAEDLATMSRQVPRGTKFVFENVYEGSVSHWEANATWDALDAPVKPVFTHYPPGVRSAGLPDMRETNPVNPTYARGHDYEGPYGVGSQDR